jgi:POT family proton-dependent oligopeptide transporter
VSNLGWIYFTPTMTAIVSRLAPASLNATMIGVNTLSVSLGSIVSGRLGGLYERVSPFTFWTIHAALVGLGGVLLLLIGMGVRQSTRLRFPLSPDGGEGKVGGESARAFLPKPPPQSSSVP